MKKSLIVIAVSVLVLVIVAMIIGGWNLILEGLETAWNTAIQSALMLVVSFIVIAQIQILLSRERMDSWLGKYSGVKGIAISAIAGGLIPGGPYVYYPFAKSFAEKGLPAYILIAFLFGKHLYDFSRLPMEISLIDPQIALIRNLITLPIPIIAGLLAEYLLKNRTKANLFSEGEV
ncbi:MAG: permease [Anaerolineaceae bacterium]